MTLWQRWCEVIHGHDPIPSQKCERGWFCRLCGFGRPVAQKRS